MFKAVETHDNKLLDTKGIVTISFKLYEKGRFVKGTCRTIRIKNASVNEAFKAFKKLVEE